MNRLIRVTNTEEESFSSDGVPSELEDDMNLKSNLNVDVDMDTIYLNNYGSADDHEIDAKNNYNDNNDHDDDNTRSTDDDVRIYEKKQNSNTNATLLFCSQLRKSVTITGKNMNTKINESFVSLRDSIKENKRVDEMTKSLKKLKQSINESIKDSEKINNINASYAKLRDSIKENSTEKLNNINVALATARESVWVNHNRFNDSLITCWKRDSNPLPQCWTITSDAVSKRWNDTSNTLLKHFKESSYKKRLIIALSLAAVTLVLIIAIGVGASGSRRSNDFSPSLPPLPPTNETISITTVAQEHDKKVQEHDKEAQENDQNSAMLSRTPSLVPSFSPSDHDSTKSEPSVIPSTAGPTALPTAVLTTSPTASPTTSHMASQTFLPTASPTVSPTASPTTSRTTSPTVTPTFLPTVLPTARPTESPTASPSVSPTKYPSGRPSYSPSDFASSNPTWMPTEQIQPVANPPVLPLHSATGNSTSTEEITTFCVIADVPYNEEELEELPVQISTQMDGCEFLIHLGDIFVGGTECSIEDYATIQEVMLESHLPVFVVPGDNEWNDCKRQSIDTGWDHWTDHFLEFESHWNHTFSILRQPDFEENFYFIHKRTLFIGLNIVAGRVHDAAEWKTRLQSEYLWVKGIIEMNLRDMENADGVILMAHAHPNEDHHEFFKPFGTFIKNELENEFPVLYLHGDGHDFLHTPYFHNQSNYLRIQHEGGTNEPVLKIMSSPQRMGRRSSAYNAYQYDRQLHLLNNK